MRFSVLLLRLSVVPLLLACFLLAPDARAQRRGFGPNPDRAPSVFAYGFRGLAIGAPVGMAAGYLITRGGSWGSEEWRGLAYGAGIGAVAGGGGGLGAGFYDLQERRPGVGMVVLRDTWYGTAFGATLGLITGAVILVESGDPEHLAKGAAWGAVIGAPVGTIIGFIEGPRVRDSAGTWPSQTERGTVVSVGPVGIAGNQGELAWGPLISGQF